MGLYDGRYDALVASGTGSALLPSLPANYQPRRAGPTSARTFNGIDAGMLPNQKANAQSIDDIIRQSQPVAEDILRSGTNSALNFSRDSQQNVENSLSQFLNPQALEEQAALLGARGQGAQRNAIANIPVSAAQAEADRRQSVGLQRRASAGGELGAGSTMLAAGQMAGQQQTNRVANRVEQLEQLAGIDRQLMGDISRNREAEMSRQAALQAGLGGQIANVGMGLAGPAVESMQTQAEIAGLRGIASANRSASNASSIANLAGQVFTPGNIQGMANFFTPAPTPTYTNPNYSPTSNIITGGPSGGNINYSPVPQINFGAQ